MTGARAMARSFGRGAIAAALLVALSGAVESVSAQIYEWVDQAGDRHFGTPLDQVPEEVRDQARIVVRAGTSNPAAADTGASTPAEPNAAESLPDHTFQAGWDAGFRAGWEAGYRGAAEEQPVCPAEPGVVVLQSQPPVVVNVPPYDPSGAYYRSPYGGSLTTVPFDDGASFGLTSRNQIQQQRAIERGW